ncbi:MAG: glycosyl hydrolase family 28 protein [Opitutaceae bacterium]|nr:glycosyl hydrolase family 28 protein [Opitutaceae bacterium]
MTPARILTVFRAIRPATLRLPALLCVGAFIWASEATLGAAPAANRSLPAPVGLETPPLARTATTAVLTWDRPAGGEGIASYQVFCDGELAGETMRLSFTARNLTPGRMHRLTVRSRGLDGRSSPPSDPIGVQTKPAGKVFNVREHGARGDGVTKDTAAIQHAIAACTPGGTVLIPPGVYLVDHLDLKSDMSFELATGATLQFLGRGEGSYPETRVMLPGPDGELCHPNFALISAVRADRLTITGNGVVRANGESWWPHRDAPRPRVLKFIACSDVFVQDITLDDSPAWNTHVVYVDRAVFSQVKFRKVSTARGANGDGLNPDSSRDILIVGCTFANQDDSIAIKSGRVSEQQPRRQRSCENITIRDCLVDGTLTPGAHPLGFAVGSETCGGVRHVLVRDCVFRNAASVMNLKANRERPGAVVEDIRVENCVYINSVFGDEPWNRAPLTFDLFYYRLTSLPDSVAPLTPATPVFRDIHFKNITIENPKGRFAYLCGLAEQPARNITFENVTGSAKTGFHGQNLDGVELSGVAITAQEGPALEWINTRNRTIRPGASAAGRKAVP